MSFWWLMLECLALCQFTKTRGRCHDSALPSPTRQGTLAAGSGEWEHGQNLGQLGGLEATIDGGLPHANFHFAPTLATPHVGSSDLLGGHAPDTAPLADLRSWLGLNIQEALVLTQGLVHRRLERLEERIETHDRFIANICVYVNVISGFRFVKRFPHSLC
jgi:hypothetical protein